jgi:hypothetical protein
LRLVVVRARAGNRGAHTVCLHLTVDQQRVQNVSTGNGAAQEACGAKWAGRCQVGLDGILHPIRGPRGPATGKATLPQRAHPLRCHGQPVHATTYAEAPPARPVTRGPPRLRTMPCECRPPRGSQQASTQGEPLHCSLHPYSVRAVVGLSGGGGGANRLGCHRREPVGGGAPVSKVDRFLDGPFSKVITPLSEGGSVGDFKNLGVKSELLVGSGHSRLLPFVRRPSFPPERDQAAEDGVQQRIRGGDGRHEALH